MGTGVVLRNALVATVATLIAALAAGCGGGAGDGEQTTGGVTESFVGLVGDLNDAARSGEEMEAVERAEKELEGQEKKTFVAFCETAWKLDVQGELDELADTDQLVERIRYWTEYDFANKDSPAVAAALARLRRDTELAAWDAADDRRYKHACYGSGNP